LDFGFWSGEWAVRIIGLTGGIGSGKSEAARRFEELGIPVVDADDVGHEVLAPGTEIFNDLLGAFGDDILSDGSIDRRKLAAVAFADAQSVRKLNAITHPAIIRRIANQCRTLARQGHAVAIVEATIMGEGDRLEPWLHGLILVTCREDLRLARVVAARDLDEAETRRRMAAQTPPEKKAPLADWVIENEGGIEELRIRVAEVAEAIRGQVA